MYDILYTYDQLGNRMSKIDYGADPDRKTLYFYDSDPNNRDPDYPTNNNRLLWYEEYIDVGGWTLTRMVRYTYYVNGHVSNITVKDEGVGEDYDWYRDLSMYYDGAGRLWRVLWDHWKVNQQEQITDYEMLAAREFYYDGLGQRYLARDVEPHDYDNRWPALNPRHWTDYAGHMPYADFDVTVIDPNDPNAPDIDEDTAYLSGFGSGLVAQQSVADPNTLTQYFHGDLIDSTMLTTDPNGVATASLAYTAFGEPIGDIGVLNTRYQYAGGYGYESDLLWLDGAPVTAPITLQHVGARWYQPDIGRFIQRDPIGIGGGFNLYKYIDNQPTTNTDPTGLMPPGGGCPYCGKMYCHCHHRPKPPKPPEPKPKPKPRPKRNGPKVHLGPRPEPWPKNVVKCTMDDYLPFIDLPVNALVNWTRLYCIWIPYEEGVIRCFPTGTQVHTPDGLVRVEDVRTGTIVISGHDACENDMDTARVTAITRSWATDMIHIRLRNEVITCTNHHPFWVDQRGWVEAQDLMAGDSLMDKQAQAVPVIAVEHVRQAKPVQVFDLTVSSHHTYYVGKAAILVHNKPN